DILAKRVSQLDIEAAAQGIALRKSTGSILTAMAIDINRCQSRWGIYAKPARILAEPAGAVRQTQRAVPLGIHHRTSRRQRLFVHHLALSRNAGGPADLQSAGDPRYRRVGPSLRRPRGRHRRPRPLLPRSVLCA